ncbi:hypothetical protein VYU27_010015, partial [Nannochloropsis oceanica]
HNSIVLMIEAEVAYIVSYLRQMKTCGATVSLLKPSVEEAFMEEMRGRMRSTVWETGGCRSWYLSSPSEKHSNTTTVLWPGHVQEYVRRTREAAIGEEFDLWDVDGRRISAERARRLVEGAREGGRGKGGWRGWMKSWIGAA